MKNKRHEDEVHMQDGSDGEMVVPTLGKVTDELGYVLDEDMMLN